MPVKYICDSCDKETNRNYSTDIMYGRDIETDTLYEINIGTFNKQGATIVGVICKRCLVKVLRNVVRLLTEEPRTTNKLIEGTDNAGS